MFKKGQLVREPESGEVYLISGDGAPGSLLWFLDALVAERVSDGEICIGLFEKCKLIGNNYQAKPKCSR